MLLGGRFNLASRRPLYSTCSMNFKGGWPLARMRAAAHGVRDARAVRILVSYCRGSNLPAFQLRKESPVQSFGVGQKENCEPLQMHAQLVAEYIGGVGQLRGYFR